MIAILSLPMVALFGFYESNVPHRSRGLPSAPCIWRDVSFGGACFLEAEPTRKRTGTSRQPDARLNRKPQIGAKPDHPITEVGCSGATGSGCNSRNQQSADGNSGLFRIARDIPALSESDQENAQIIQQQVHKAQAAVTSLRSSLRGPLNRTPSPLQKRAKPQLKLPKVIGKGSCWKNRSEVLPSPARPGIPPHFFPIIPLPQLKCRIG